MGAIYYSQQSRVFVISKMEGELKFSFQFEELVKAFADYLEITTEQELADLHVFVQEYMAMLNSHELPEQLMLARANTLDYHDFKQELLSPRFRADGFQLLAGYVVPRVIAIVVAQLVNSFWENNNWRYHFTTGLHDFAEIIAKSDDSRSIVFVNSNTDYSFSLVYQVIDEEVGENFRLDSLVSGE